MSSPAERPLTAGTLHLVLEREASQAAQTDGEPVRCGDQAVVLQDSLARTDILGSHQDPPHPGPVGLLVQLGHGGQSEMFHWLALHFSWVEREGRLGS